ncbi:hypothetical protein H4R34_004395 [Dimargaris verticillata]|uniref:Polynucleotide adenylyltransferase n=1 Tax=Dimargaris verticillata TaxID=2761393 RepID=A0A9W8B4F4_9FUNG|nr:hypothetical protein H4R34_004395 [Dimargaris verticillata]
MSRFPHAQAFVTFQQAHQFRLAVNRAHLRLARFVYHQLQENGGRPISLPLLHYRLKQDQKYADSLPRKGLLPVLKTHIFEQYFRVIEYDSYMKGLKSWLPAPHKASSTSPSSRRSKPPSAYAKPCLDSPELRPAKLIPLAPLRYVEPHGKPLDDAEFLEFSVDRKRLPLLSSDPAERPLLPTAAKASWGPSLDKVRQWVKSAPLTTGTQIRQPYPYSREQDIFLTQQLMTRYLAVCPTSDRLGKVNQMITRLREAFSRGFPNRDYRMELVGSYATCLAHQESDINVLMILPNKKIIQPDQSPEEKVETLREFIYALIGGALKRNRFPVIRNEALIRSHYGYHENYTPVTIIPDDPLPYFEAKLIKAYGDFDPRVRPLVQTVLTWARTRGILAVREHNNDTFDKRPAFETPILVHLVLAFLQYRGILPSLQRIDDCIYQNRAPLDNMMQSFHRVQEEQLERMRRHEQQHLASPQFAKALRMRGDASRSSSASPMPLYQQSSHNQLEASLLTETSQCLCCHRPLPQTPLGDANSYFLAQAPPDFAKHEQSAKRNRQKVHDAQHAAFERVESARYQADYSHFQWLRSRNAATRARTPMRHELRGMHWHYPQLTGDNEYPVPYMALYPSSFVEQCGFAVVHNKPMLEFEPDYEAQSSLEEADDPQEEFRTSRTQTISWRPLTHLPRFLTQLDIPLVQSQVPPQDASIVQLLLEFFRFFGHEVPYTQAMVSVRLGGVVPRSLAVAAKHTKIAMPLPATTKAFEDEYCLLAVEHPFAPAHNVASYLQPWQVEGLAWEFRRAYDVLATPLSTNSSDTPDQPRAFNADDILDRLMKPYSDPYYGPQWLRAYRLSSRFWEVSNPQWLDTLPSESEDIKAQTDGEILDRWTASLPSLIREKSESILPEEHEAMHSVRAQPVQLIDPKLEMVFNEFYAQVSLPLKHADAHWTVKQTPQPKPVAQTIGMADAGCPSTMDVPAANTNLHVVMPNARNEADQMRADTLTAYDIAFDEVFQQYAQEEGDPNIPPPPEMVAQWGPEAQRLVAQGQVRLPENREWKSGNDKPSRQERDFLQQHGVNPTYIADKPNAPYYEFIREGKVVVKS